MMSGPSLPVGVHRRGGRRSGARRGFRASPAASRNRDFRAGRGRGSSSAATPDVRSKRGTCRRQRRTSPPQRRTRRGSVCRARSEWSGRTGADGASTPALRPPTGTPRQLRDHPEVPAHHTHLHRTEGPRPPGAEDLRDRRQGHRRPNARATHHTEQRPAQVELHHRTHVMKTESIFASTLRRA